MSHRKQRQLDRTPLDERLLDGIRTVCRAWPVESVSGEMAGYFNELGISIRLGSTATDLEVASLRVALIEFLDAFYESLSPPFKWMVMFSRGGRHLDPLIQRERDT